MEEEQKENSIDLKKELDRLREENEELQLKLMKLKALGFLSLELRKQRINLRSQLLTNFQAGVITRCRWTTAPIRYQRIDVKQ
jgi:hypothetical protein